MCWLSLTLGLLMTAGGVALIVRFFAGRGANLPELAGVGRTESMIMGVLLASIGPLLLYFGATGAICRGLGLG